MKTVDVTVPDEVLNDLIDIYKDANPIEHSASFALYLCLEELKRFRHPEPPTN